MERVNFAKVCLVVDSAARRNPLKSGTRAAVETQRGKEPT